MLLTPKPWILDSIRINKLHMD